MKLYSLKRTSSALAASLLAFGLVASADAQVILTAADSHTGTAGAPGTPFGSSGGNGYEASSSVGSSFIVNGAAFTGGVGGTTTGTNAAVSYQGGNGGDGLVAATGALGTMATINSGAFTGGAGGSASGVGLVLTGGFGGDGLLAVGLVNVYGGTFQGGVSGAVTGTGTLRRGGAGSGVNANSNGTINIFGGTFIGAGGAVLPSGQYTFAGNGLEDLGANLNVYGGSFTGGTTGRVGSGLYVGLGTTTLYGTNFLVNGVPVTSGPVTGDGIITGTFADNSGSSAFSYTVGSGGSLFIRNAPPSVPEASTTISLGLLLVLGLGGVLVAKKRKAVSSPA